MNDTNAPRATGVSFYRVSDAEEGQRIDNFLIKYLKGVPKSRVYRLVRKGEVRVNKSRVKAEYKLVPGDEIRIPPVRLAAAAPAPAPSNQLVELLDAAVLYEDEQLLVINKPSGLAVHGGSGINLGLIESLRKMRPQVRFLELVHRLDRDTSGCVMVAKKRSMLRYLHAALREGGVEKVYCALVQGRWPNRREWVNAPLQKNVLRSGERMVTVDDEGKRSRTRFRVLERFQGATLVQASPVTGRTHQIRVHAQHAGHPILGDDKYANSEAATLAHQCGLRRLFLHAQALTIPQPDTDAVISVEAPLDPGLVTVLERLREEVAPC